MPDDMVSQLQYPKDTTFSVCVNITVHNHGLLENFLQITQD